MLPLPAGILFVAIASTDTVGVPVTLTRGVTQTVDEIMERERLLPPFYLRQPRAIEQESEFELVLRDDPDAPPPRSHWPPIPDAPFGIFVPIEPALPQTIGTSFKAVTYSEGFNYPPDNGGDVGPTQILVHVNGRIKVFDKTGTPGALDAASTTFWASVAGPNFVADPQVRYDRLSGRWFVLTADFGVANNRIMIAVSSGPTITGTVSFTYYVFQIASALPADASYLCDYPSLG